MQAFTAEQEAYFIDGIKNRNETIFSEFYAITRPIIGKFLFVKFPHRMPSEIDDVLQDFFTKIWLKIDSFQGKCKFITWLYKIAINIVIDKVIRDKHYNNCISLNLMLEEGKDFPHHRPLDSNEHLLNEIAEIKNCLGENHLAVFNIIFERGIPFHTAAKMLNVPMGTVQSRSHYLKKKLKERLSEFQKA